MFRPMRKSDRAMSEERTRALLVSGSVGVLGTVGADGYPYAVPLSYVADDDGGFVYFHCAGEGQKLDNLLREPRVSFCVVGENEPARNGEFTTYYESVIAFGRADVVDGDEEKRGALRRLMEKYTPGHGARAEAAIESGLKAVTIVRIQIEHLTGKKRQQDREGG